jgi:hypothetical protein
MPNRILIESICTSDNLNELTVYEEVFFYRLITICDDYGITDARVKILRSKCFPLKTDTIKEADIEKWLKALIRANLCFLYEVQGKRYLKMTSWEQHQQIRAKRSKYPLPDINGNHLIANDDTCPRNPIQSESESESESNPKPSREPKKENRFSEFWFAYPRKDAKKDAQKAWDKLSPDDELFKNIMGGLENAKKSRDWIKDKGQYIPYAATWLNGERWKDEYSQGGEGGNVNKSRDYTG